MKKFSFPLARVMDFRRLQARVEEAKLEKIYAELRAVDARENAMRQQRAEAGKAMQAVTSAMGSELAMLGQFDQAFIEERKRMDKIRVECRKRIAMQFNVLMKKRRDVRLLEKLKDQRFEVWEKEMWKEIDQQAEESYVSKWSRD
jgi:flagellar export protein FliJ